MHGAGDSLARAGACVFQQELFGSLSLLNILEFLAYTKWHLHYPSHPGRHILLTRLLRLIAICTSAAEPAILFASANLAESAAYDMEVSFDDSMYGRKEAELGNIERHTLSAAGIAYMLSSWPLGCSASPSALDLPSRLFSCSWIYRSL